MDSFAANQMLLHITVQSDGLKTFHILNLYLLSYSKVVTLVVRYFQQVSEPDESLPWPNQC